MHIPDTRLNRALMEARLAEAQRTADSDWSKANHSGMWKHVADWWHNFTDKVTRQPPGAHTGGFWHHHRPLHH